MVVDIAAPTYNINDFFDNGHYYYITHIPEYRKHPIKPIL